MAVHSDEIPLDLATARRLIAAQFPAWRDDEVHPIAADGTVNTIFRIGETRAARFPRLPADPVTQLRTLETEAAAMHDLARHSPVATPLPLAIGRPDTDYPLPWSVQSWIPGRTATPDVAAHSPAFARDLAELLRALRDADTRGRTFAGSGRGGALRDSDDWMRTCFAESVDLLPVDELRTMWSALRALPRSSPDAMTHGDLTPANLLVSTHSETGHTDSTHPNSTHSDSAHPGGAHPGGTLVDAPRLVGVLDGGGFGPADPALDLVAAWHLLESDARTILRDELRIDDVEWLRGAAWAFQQSMGLVWYYRDTLPAMSALGRSTLSRILGDRMLRHALTAMR